jgi:hypothetical protein
VPTIEAYVPLEAVIVIVSGEADVGPHTELTVVKSHT